MTYFQRPVFKRRFSTTYLWLATAALIVYGSLYPFQFAAAPGADVWRILVGAKKEHLSLADVLGNVALFAPYGYIGMLARRSRLWWGDAIVVGVSGGVLALLLQALQVYLPMRSPSLADVVWNLAGLALGIAGAWLLGGRGALRWPAVSRAPREALAILAIWLMSELLPLVPSLDWGYVKDNLKPLLAAHWTGLETLKHGVGALLALSALDAIAVRGRRLWGAALLAGVAVAKIFIVGQGLTVAALAGFLGGFLVWQVIRGLPQASRILMLAAVLFTASFWFAVFPFNFSPRRNTFEILPFAALLQGSMLDNVRALAGRLVIYLGLLWLLRLSSGRLLPGAVALASWVTMLEFLQLFLPGRVADLTEPLWVLLCAWLLHIQPRNDTAPLSQSTEEAPAPHSGGGPAAEENRTLAHPILGVLSAGRAMRLQARFHRTCPDRLRTFLRRGVGYGLGLTVPLWLILHLPGVPYNVRELFQAGGWPPALFIFALALLWTGASAAWIGRRLAEGASPLRFFPAAVFTATVISLMLLYASVTEESIEDISGANNLYWFVTHKSIWGDWARRAFLALASPGLVGFFERPVRFAALTAPLWFFLSSALALSERPSRAVFRAMWMAVPWLWLCKLIAFDASSTDNLNELIARGGGFGLGGGLYLYLLLALLCANSALLVRAWRQEGSGLAAWILTLSSLPLGWVLLNAGLESVILKYGQAFSGAQFLLGPDRAHRLGEAELFLRWSLVQLGTVLTLAAGAHTAYALLPAPPPRHSSGDKHRSLAPRREIADFVRPPRPKSE